MAHSLFSFVDSWLTQRSSFWEERGWDLRKVFSHHDQILNIKFELYAWFEGIGTGMTMLRGEAYFFVKDNTSKETSHISYEVDAHIEINRDIDFKPWGFDETNEFLIFMSELRDLQGDFIEAAKNLNLKVREMRPRKKIYGPAIGTPEPLGIS